VDSPSTIYCEPCARTILAQWQAWPHRTAVPTLPILVDGACTLCGADAGVRSERIRWENVHGTYNTGLPDYWLLQVDAGNAKWGRPYSSEAACPRCGGRSIVSEMKHSSRRELMLNCPACGVIRFRADHSDVR
jgi:hypothetical protein